MSRVANNPIEIPQGVDVNITGQLVSVKGSKGSLEHELHETVAINKADNVLTFDFSGKGDGNANAQRGTARQLVNNMVHGVSQGFEKKLTLAGPGYRAAVQGKKLNLTVGFSHPVDYELPEGVSVACPSQKEIVVSGIDKQSVGQVAAEIRAVKPAAKDPYKHNGIRYEGEYIRKKEVQKS